MFAVYSSFTKVDVDVDELELELDVELVSKSSKVFFSFAVAKTSLDGFLALQLLQVF